MSSLKQLSRIDHRTKLTIYGWIREVSEELNISIVPIISVICILYYHNKEIFELIGESIRLSDDKTIISKVINSGANGACDNRNYGMMVIPSESNIVCQWDLIVNKLCTFNTAVIIGVSSDPKSDTGDFFNKMDYHHYLIHDIGHKYDHKKEHWVSYAERIKKGDKVSIRLDLKNAEIEYLINDRAQGIAYKNINKGKDIKYRLMICISRENTEIEIASFQTIQIS